MPRWENNVSGRLTQADRLDVGMEVVRPNDPVDGLFGDMRTDNLIAEWETIAAQYQIPVMAQFHAFDVEAQTTLRIPVDSRNIEKGLIKVKINQSERLRALTGRGVVSEDSLYARTLDDAINLADQVATRSKVAKHELLATGKVTINENNLALSVDYGVPAAQTALTLDLATGSDLSAQLQAIVDQAAAAGVILTGMVTSRKNITKMRNNSGLQKNINANYGVGALIQRTDFNTYFDTELGISQIITDDLMYTTPYIMGTDGRPVVNQKRYYPENKVTFFGTAAGGRLGVGLWGDPPETDVSNLISVTGSNQPYIYITQWSTEDPAVLWTKASALFMPVLYNPNSLWIATVTDSTEDDGA